MDELDQLTDQQLAGWKSQNQAVLDKEVLASPEKLDALSDEELTGLKQRQHEVLLAPFREQARAGQGAYSVSEGVVPYLGRQFVSPIRSLAMGPAYGVAKDRLNRNEHSDSDLRAIAAYEHEQGLDQAQPEWAKWAGVAAAAPGTVAEFGLAPGLSFAAHAGAGAIAQGGLNAESLLKGGAQAAVQVGVLKSLGPIAKTIFPQAEGILATAGTHALTGSVGLALADYGTKLAGLSESGGPIGEALAGHYGEAARGFVANAVLTFGTGAFGAIQKGYSKKVATEKAVENVQKVAEQAATGAVQEEARSPKLKIGDTEVLTPQSKDLNPAERYAVDKYGENKVLRVGLNGPDGPMGSATLAEEGDTIHVAWVGKTGLAGGEGRGKNLFGAREVFSLATQLAEAMPDAKFLKYTVSEGRIGEGKAKIVDLDAIRRRGKPNPDKNPATVSGSEEPEATTLKTAASEPRPEPVNASQPAPEAPGASNAKDTTDATAAKMTAEELHRRLVNGEPIPGVSPDQADDLRKTVLQGQSLEDAAQERGVSKQAVDQSVGKAAQSLHGQVEEPGEPAVAEEKGPRKPTRAEAKMAGLRIGPIGENSKIADIGKVDAAIDKLLTEKARLKKTGQLTQEKEAEINSNKAELFQTRTAMGAAALGELVPPAGMFERPEFEALANEVVHAHRMSDQAAPVFKQATQSDAQVWEDAAERIRLDPKAGSKLVEELNDKPRPMTGTEDIVLLREMAERRQRWRRLSEEVERLGSTEAADQAWQQLDQAYRDMTDADSAASKAGSEAGRAFRLRRLMMAEDYSPQGLMRRFQSKLGRPATPEEAQELEKDAASVGEAQVKVGEASGEESSRRLDEADAAATKAAKEPADKPRRRKEADSLILAATDKARKAAGDDRALGTLAAKLFTAVAERGVQGRDNRLAAVHEILKSVIPDLTLDRTRELVVGRGESRPYTKDELHASIDKDKGELRQVDRLVGMSEGVPPQKYRGSVERYTPSQTERDLQRQVRQKARELGFDRYDAEGALKSRLASAKTRAENEIADLMREIQTGERRPAKAGIEPDAELKAKQNLVEILRNARNAAVPKPNEAPQDFLNRQIAAAERAAQAWQERAISAKAGVFPEKTAKATPPEVQVIRDRADAWKAEYQTLKAIRDAKAAESEAAAKLEAAKQGKFEAREGPVQGPKTQAEATVADTRERADQARAETRKLWLETPEGKKWQDELRNRQLQAHYADRVAKLREMLANDDFTKPPKREFQPNDLTIKAREDLARVQTEVDRRIEEKRLLARGKWEKTRDLLVDLRRAFLLSNPVTTVVKIPAAAAEKIVFNTLEELTGAVWGYTPGIGRFAGKASVEGGFSLAGEKAAYTRGMRMGFKDFWQRLTKGDSDVDVAYGKEDPEIQLRQSWLKMPGQIHGAEKAIPFRTDFERRAEKLFADARRKGVNIDEGGVQDRLLTEAYRKALDSQFGEDNRFIQRWQRYVGELNNSDVAHERLAGFLGKMLLPIVKVPTNIAAQTAEAVAGVPIGLTRAVYNGIRNGVANTSPEVANGIMRQLKRGSIGSALMAVGFAVPGAFGGYYQPREKRDEQDAKFGSVKIFGMNVPSVLLHNPALEALQFGATVRRVSDKHWSKRMGGEPKGISEGIMAATAGLAEEVPLVREMTQVDKLLNSDERPYAIGAEAKSFTVPGIVDWLARQMDKKTPFSPSEEPQKRKPEGVIQHIQTGIPVYREKVPAKK